MKTTLFLSGMFAGSIQLLAQCVSNTSNIYTFNSGGIKYEIVKETLSWKDAASCAKSRGGKLVEIDSKAEQDAIQTGISAANIISSNTKAADGDNQSFLWIGGNDMNKEGTWIWDGAQSGSGTNFWQGAWPTGTAVNNSFSTWSTFEPDNKDQAQDALAFPITKGMFIEIGKWCDLKESNTLYYIIEYPFTTNITETISEQLFSFSESSNQEIITLNVPNNLPFNLSVYDVSGHEVLKIDNEKSISLTALQPGMYVLVMEQSGKKQYSKWIK